MSNHCVERTRITAPLTQACRPGDTSPARIGKRETVAQNEIGVMAGLKADAPGLKCVADFGLSCCQLVSWRPDLWTDGLAERVRKESEESGVRITAFWSG